MNFTEVVNEVLSITNRPEKVNDVRRAVNAAINFCVTEGNFARDLEEIELVTTSDEVFTIPLTDLPRFRKVMYMVPNNRRVYIKHTSADKVFTKEFRERRDVFYVVGSEIKVALCKPSSSLKIGYFTYAPVLTDASPTFWLLDLSPYMIIHHAAAAIFRMTGDGTDADRHMAMFNLEFTSAMRDYKYGANYG